MYGIGPIQLAIGLVVIFLLEIALFWVATALADLPPMGWGKILLVVLIVTGISVALTSTLGWYSGTLDAPLAPENRPMALSALGLAVVVLWAVPAVLYPMFLSVSIPRSMWVALLQVLLRAFLYVLIVAIVMLVLAVAQIWFGGEVRSQQLSPPAQDVIAWMRK